MKTKLTNLLRAAAIVTGMAGGSAALANGTDEPSNPQPCNDVTCPVPGGDTINNGGTGIGTGIGIGIGTGGDGGDGGAGGAGGNATVNNNINTPRQVANAPAAIAYANGNCQTGVGVSIGTIGFGGGVSFARTDYKCMDYQAAQFLVDSGLRFQRGEIAILGLATFNQVSENIARATELVADGYRRCGSRAMEQNLVIGTDIAVNGGACPSVETRHVETRRAVVATAAVPVERERTVAACQEVIEAARMCVARNPGLSF